MSKSDPNSAIFMEDTEAEVNTKIKKAYCPPQVGLQAPLPGASVRIGRPQAHCPGPVVLCAGVASPAAHSPTALCLLVARQVVEGNPCIEYVCHIVFPWFGSFKVRAPTHHRHTSSPANATAWPPITPMPQARRPLCRSFVLGAVWWAGSCR